MLSEPSQLHPTCRPRLLISTISHHPGIIKDCPIPAPSLSHHLLSKYNKYLQIINCFFNGDSISPPLYPLPPGPGRRPASISSFLLMISQFPILVQLELPQHVFSESNNGMEVPSFYRNSEDVPYYFKMTSHSYNLMKIKKQSLPSPGVFNENYKIL